MATCGLIADITTVRVFVDVETPWRVVAGITDPWRMTYDICTPWQPFAVCGTLPLIYDANGRFIQDSSGAFLYEVTDPFPDITDIPIYEYDALGCPRFLMDSTGAIMVELAP